MDDYQMKVEANLEGHTERVWCVRWHPSGKYIASCSADRTIRIWGKEGDTWRCRSILSDAHSRTIRYIAWSHDGRFLASTSFDATTVIWHCKGRNVEDEEDPEWSVMFSLEGHENEVKAAAWSPDDSYLATCSRDKAVWIWEKIEAASSAAGGDVHDEPVDDDEAFFECASVQTEHSQDVKRVLWHPKLNILVSASFDNHILMYVQGDEDWVQFSALSEHESTVWALDFNPSGTRLVSASADESIKVWQPSNFTDVSSLLSASPLPKGSDRKFAELASKWTIVASLSGYHQWPIYDVSWSPLNNCILTCGADNSLHVFAELRNNIAAEKGEEEEASENGRVRYRQICVQEEAHDQDVNSVHWNPKEESQLASGSDDAVIRIWTLHKV
ncbi:cytosolic iron-sulfur protein assembly [Tyrophagus putrescentiae]|nr:cytosolic iron-sulfur protein assembly [Tyrophagus putrescentiae]